jgi:hypothetical protein
MGKGALMISDIDKGNITAWYFKGVKVSVFLFFLRD